MRRWHESPAHHTLFRPAHVVRPLVGKVVPYHGEWPESGYKSREPAGYTNFVRFADAEIIEVPDDPAHS